MFSESDQLAVDLCKSCCRLASDDECAVVNGECRVYPTVSRRFACRLIDLESVYDQAINRRLTVDVNAPWTGRPVQTR